MVLPDDSFVYVAMDQIRKIKFLVVGYWGVILLVLTKCQHASVVNSLKVMMKNHQMFGMMRTRMQSKQNTPTQVCHLV